MSKKVNGTETWACAEIFPEGGNVNILLVLADDPMQTYIHETFYQFYTTAPKENAHVTIMVTKLRSVGSRNPVAYITIIFTIGYLQIFKAGYFFSQKYCHGLTKPQIRTLFYLARLINVIQKHELQTSGILSKAINHPFSKILLVFADFFTLRL